MEPHNVKIKSIKPVTHNVLQITTTKPVDFIFVPGQATELSINKPGLEMEKRPFTFTSLPSEEHLSFVIKIYPFHHGFTEKLPDLKENDELKVHEVFGAIEYKGEGVFIAGGAGVTPFISIFKSLKKQNKIGNNKLIFANKTKSDIIYEQEFEKLLGKNFINILSREKTIRYASGHITKEFLSPHVNDFHQKFYLCGPEGMMEAVEEQLNSLGVKEQNIIKEEF